jgi:hypothetical protein
MDIAPPSPWSCSTETPESAWSISSEIHCLPAACHLPPRKEFSRTGVRQYNEWVTGDHAWEIQVRIIIQSFPDRLLLTFRLRVFQSRLPEGATALGIITSSDKTLLTSHTGSKEAHPLLISLANIDMDLRSKSSYHAFLLLGLLPIPKFHTTDKKLLPALYHRVIHLCLDKVFAPLKKIAIDGAMMVDPNGKKRRCFTFLASYMVDHPEARMLAGVIGLTSPVTTADYRGFGDPSPHPRRHGYDTVATIESITTRADPWEDINLFVRLCNQNRLTGIHRPFFRDWLLADPTWFLTPDSLHGLLKKFKDHDLQWCAAALSASELDFRFSVLPPRVGFRHFHNGVTKLKMSSGREHRDIQRSIVAVIAGGCSLQFIRCIRALIDFYYISQQRNVTETDLETLDDLLTEFHAHKNVILEERLRASSTWRIPKVELLQNTSQSIKKMGSANQWSTDRTEHAHIEVVKEPFRASNRKDFNPQICRSLDRAEKRRFFDLCTAIKARRAHVERGDDGPPPMEAISGWLKDIELVESLAPIDQDVTDYFSIAEDVQHMRIHQLKPVKQLTKKRTFSTCTTVLHLNGEYDLKLSIDEICERYHLPDFKDAMVDFWKHIDSSRLVESLGQSGQYPLPAERDNPCIGRRRQRIGEFADETLPFDEVRVWFQVRVQTRWNERGRIAPSVVVKAFPPNLDGDWRYGVNGHCLFKNDPTKDWNGLAEEPFRGISLLLVLSSHTPPFRCLSWRNQGHLPAGHEVTRKSFLCAISRIC